MVNGPSQPEILTIAQQQARVFQAEIERTGGIVTPTRGFIAVTPAARGISAARRARITRENKLIKRRNVLRTQIPGIERELRTFQQIGRLGPVELRRLQRREKRLDNLVQESRRIDTELSPGIVGGVAPSVRSPGRFTRGQRLGEEVFVSRTGQRVSIPSRFDDPEGFRTAQARVERIRATEAPQLTPAQRIGAGVTEQLVTGAAGFFGPVAAVRPAIVATRSRTLGGVVLRQPSGEVGAFETIVTGRVTPRRITRRQPPPIREVITRTRGEFLAGPTGVEARGTIVGVERVGRRFRRPPVERRLPREELREVTQITEEGLLSPGLPGVTLGRARTTRISPRPGVEESVFVARRGFLGETEVAFVEAGQARAAIIRQPFGRPTAPRAPGLRASELRQAGRSVPTQAEIQAIRGLTPRQARTTRQRLVREEARRLSSQRTPTTRQARGPRVTRDDTRQAQQQVQSQVELQRLQGLSVTAARQLRGRLVRQEAQRVATQRRQLGVGGVGVETGISLISPSQVVTQVTSQGVLSPRLEQVQAREPISGLFTGPITTSVTRQRRVPVPARGLEDITIQQPVTVPGRLVPPAVEIEQITEPIQIPDIGVTGFFGTPTTGRGGFRGFFPPLPGGRQPPEPTRRRRRARRRGRRRFVPTIAAGVLGIEAELPPEQLGGLFTGLEIRPLQPSRRRRRNGGLPRGIL